MIKRIQALFFACAMMLLTTASLWVACLPQCQPSAFTTGRDASTQKIDSETRFILSALRTIIHHSIENHPVVEPASYLGQPINKLIRFLRQIELAGWSIITRDGLIETTPFLFIWSIWNPSIPIALRKLLI